MYIGTAGKVALGAVAVYFGYLLYGPKARFVGDKLKAGDVASVTISGSPEIAALLPGDSVRALVVVIDASAKDTFTGQVQGAELPAGTFNLPGGFGPAGDAPIRTFQKVAVASATRGGQALHV